MVDTFANALRRHSRAQILVSSRPSPDEGGPLESHNNDWHYYVYSLDRYTEDLHVASLSHSCILYNSGAGALAGQQPEHSADPAKLRVLSVPVSSATFRALHPRRGGATRGENATTAGTVR